MVVVTVVLVMIVVTEAVVVVVVAVLVVVVVIVVVVVVVAVTVVVVVVVVVVSVDVVVVVVVVVVAVVATTIFLSIQTIEFVLAQKFSFDFRIWLRIPSLQLLVLASRGLLESSQLVPVARQAGLHCCYPLLLAAP